MSKDMTPEEFVDLHAMFKSDLTVAIDHRNKMLSDLHSVIRGELIRYDKWCEDQRTAALILLSSEELVDKFLKDNQ